MGGMHHTPKGPTGNFLPHTPLAFPEFLQQLSPIRQETCHKHCLADSGIRCGQSGWTWGGRWGREEGARRSPVSGPRSCRCVRSLATHGRGASEAVLAGVGHGKLALPEVGVVLAPRLQLVAPGEEPAGERQASAVSPATGVSPTPGVSRPRASVPPRPQLAACQQGKGTPFTCSE